jgi:four helix bundle protein
MADSVLRAKSKEFAKSIVFLCRKLKQNDVEGALINQLLRCGTSVGANVHEAQYAQGTKDFISKFEIALKECNESEYWLELLHETNSINEVEFKSFQKECIELRRMLVSSVTTLKKKQGICHKQMQLNPSPTDFITK